MTMTTTATVRIIAGMLVENTGVHMLDSGMHSGRMWQRNQAEVGDEDPAAHFLARPEAYMDSWGGATLDIFHFLRSRLDYMPKLDRLWRLWVASVPFNRWDENARCYNSFGTMEQFHDALVAKGWADKGEELDGMGDLTYNRDNALSQDFHYFFIHMTEESPIGEGLYVFVNIHNGADARGGYTDFRAFDPCGWDGAFDLLDYDHVEVTIDCPACECHWMLDVRSGESTLYDNEGYEVWQSYYAKGVPEGAPVLGLLDLEHPVCPVCANTPTTTAWMPPVG